MLILFSAVATGAIETDRFLYYCKSENSSVEFSLVYVQKGNRIDQVKIVDRSSPRLSPDHMTRWRGFTTQQGASFDLKWKRNGLWVSGEMMLIADDKSSDHYRLTWSSVVGGTGSDVVLGTPNESADCILAESPPAKN